jgi:uncharacterized protein (TIGR02145 family)
MKHLLYSFILLGFLLSCGTENKPTYKLTTTVSPTEGGTISPSTGVFSKDEVVELIGTPSTGWRFVRWEGDWSGQVNPVNLGMNRNYNVVGIFEKRNYSLNITIVGNGTVEERIIQQKSTEYPFETVVELTPIPSEGWRFVEWGGDVSGTEVPIQITISDEKNVTATFERRNFPLTITIVGEGTVTETVIPQKSTEYSFETVVQLTPVPSEGWKFTSWGGDLSGSDNPISLTMNTDKSVTATFTELQLATITTTAVTFITTYGASSGGEITSDGGATVTARGVVWSTSQNPTVTSNAGITTNGSGTGAFTSNLTGLTAGTTYYVRAYATNSVGTAYGNQVQFTTTAGSSDGRDNTTTVVDVTNPATGRVWMDRNLGASRAATSSTDAQAYGDLYQWGRGADGHEKRNSSTTSTLSNSDQPGHGSFILTPNSPYDWRSPQNNNLWQGVNGINNPCPVEYRLPTEAELNAERASWSTNTSAGAYASPLKLPVAGRRRYSNGSLRNVGSDGAYWSGSVSGSNARFLYFDSSNASMGSLSRADGGSVRCLKD